MKRYRLSDMFKGWFVGNFSPSIYKTNDVEVAIKKYKKGDIEMVHHHRIAIEITAVGEADLKNIINIITAKIAPIAIFFCTKSTEPMI